MNFEWTDSQLALRKSTVKFAQQHLNEALIESDSTGTFPAQLWKKLADEKILASFIPVEYGGAGLDVMSAVLMLEGLGYGCRDNGLTMAVNGQVWTVQEPILRFGTEEQKKRYLPGLCSGEMLGAHAMTEPDSGSDSYSMMTTALPDEDGYVLNGTKSFIGMAPIADMALVFAKTNPDHGRWGISAFLVDLDSDGVTRGEVSQKLGTRSLPMGDLIFDDCRIPAHARLGPEGAGVSISTDSLEWERSFIFASHVGSMERQLDETVAYANQRRQFGQAIGKFQSVSNRIADMKLRLDVAKLLLYRAAWLKSEGKEAQMEAALTKLFISEAFLESSVDSVRTHGGTGYLSEAGPERDLRDSVGGVLYAGTSDIQRQLIARLLGL